MGRHDRLLLLSIPGSPPQGRTRIKIKKEQLLTTDESTRAVAAKV